MFSKEEMPSIWLAVGPVGGMGASDQRGQSRPIALKHTDATTRRASRTMARKVRVSNVVGVTAGFVRNGVRERDIARERLIEKRYQERKNRKKRSR